MRPSRRQQQQQRARAQAITSAAAQLPANTDLPEIAELLAALAGPSGDPARN